MAPIEIDSADSKRPPEVPTVLLMQSGILVLRIRSEASGSAIGDEE
jgi:hypothetical protein